MDFFDVIKKAFSGDGGDSNLSFFDFLAGDEFSDVPDLWGSGDFDFSKLTSAFNDADIAAFADLGSGSYNSIDDAIIDYAEKSGQDLATAQTKFAASGLKLEDLPGVSKFSTIKNAMKSLGMTDESGKINPAALLGLTGLYLWQVRGREVRPHRLVTKAPYLSLLRCVSVLLYPKIRTVGPVQVGVGTLVTCRLLPPVLPLPILKQPLTQCVQRQKPKLRLSNLRCIRSLKLKHLKLKRLSQLLHLLQPLRPLMLLV